MQPAPVEIFSRFAVMIVVASLLYSALGGPSLFLFDAMSPSSRAAPARPSSSLLRFKPDEWHNHFDSVRRCRKLRVLSTPFVPPGDEPSPEQIFAQRRPSGVPGGSASRVRVDDDMLRHIEDAFEAVHPFTSADSGLRPHLKEVVRRLCSFSAPDQVDSFRASVFAELRSISEAQRPITEWLVSLMPPHVHGIAGVLDLGLWAALLDAFADWPHRDLIYDLVYGFVQVGEVPSTGLFRPVDRPPQADFNEVLPRNSEDASRLASAARASAARNPGAARQLWARTMSEVDKGLAHGPFSKDDLDGLWGEGGWRAMLRFGVLQKGKLRPCDDAKRSLINALSHMFETLVIRVQADFGLRVAREFAQQLDVYRIGIEMGTDDVQDAYKVIPTSQPFFSVPCLADPDAPESDDLFFVVPGLPFGKVASVTNFNSVMEFSTFVCASLLLTPTDHMFDDVPTVDRAGFALGSQSAVRRFHAESLRLPFSDAKHVPASLVCKFLGTFSDFSRAASHGILSMYADEDRILECLEVIGASLRSGGLGFGDALSLQGRLSFTLLSQMAKVGRTALPCLYWHSTGPSRSISDSTRDSLQFISDVLLDLKPYEAEVRARLGPQPLIWTDAMFERDGVRLASPERGCRCAIGYVLWCPRSYRFFIGEMDLSLELLQLVFGERDTYIGHAEELAAAAVYSTCPELLRDSYPIHFIDNQGALGILCRGSSSHAPMGLLAHQTAAAQLELNARVWYEYVASKANIADLPSRHDTRLACRNIRARFGTRVVHRPIRLPPLTAA